MASDLSPSTPVPALASTPLRTSRTALVLQTVAGRQMIHSGVVETCEVVSSVVKGLEQALVCPALEEKEEEMENKYFAASIAPGTLALYTRKWSGYQDFCSRRQFSLVPSEGSIKSFILFLSDKMKVFISGIDLILAAIAFFCSELSYTNPIPSSSHLARLVKGIRNVHSVPITQKVPLTPEDIIKLFDLHFSQPDNVVYMRVVLIFSLCFLLCLRLSEAANLISDNIVKIGGKFKLQIVRSKNQKRGFTKTVNIDKRNKYCTGLLLSNYLKKMSISLFGPARPIFCRFYTSPSGVVSPQHKAVFLSTLSLALIPPIMGHIVVVGVLPQKLRNWAPIPGS